MSAASKKQKPAPTPTTNSRPPVVVVMGHVDHGKTTLLDHIRHTNVAGKESAGITQHIGAYQARVPHEGKESLITFIDTPGHEAFSAMRSRGGKVADIAVLVVAADDGVKPQTEEAIAHIKAAAIPMIVAINKMDLPTANADRVKKGLAEQEVLVEGYGGNVAVAEISAKTGAGVPELLELLLLTAELEELKGDPAAAATGVVIEGKLDKFRGPVATVIVKDGTLRLGDEILVGGVRGKIKQMVDGFGTKVSEAGPATPVEILGLESVPAVGAELGQGAASASPATPATSEPTGLEKKPDQINLIIKADFAGSLEAILGSLGQLPQEVTKLNLLHSGTGEITDSDINLARATGAFVLGFRVKPSASAARLAETQKVQLMTYEVIYELIDDMKAALEGISLAAKPIPTGVGEIIATFPYNDKLIFGTRVKEGSVNRGQPIKVVRGEEEVAAGRVKSIRHVKDEVPKAEVGKEYGILVDLSSGSYEAVALGDQLQSFPKS